MLKRIFLTISAIFLFSQVAYGLGSNMTFWGPSELSVGPWHLYGAVERFSIAAPCNALLQISKTGSDGQVLRGGIILNSTLVALKDFLAGNDMLFQEEVELFEHNRMIIAIYGNPGASLMLELRQSAPEPMGPEISFQSSPESVQPGESVTLSWESPTAQTIYIDNGIGTVTDSGTLNVVLDHTTTFTITATDDTGSSSARTSVRVLGDPEPQPVGSFGKQYLDLVPADAVIDAYDTGRFSVITGMVKDDADLPLSDVFIGLIDHPEYGTALTDAEGHFSIPVEGGKTYTVTYNRENLLEVHRKIYVPWNDIALIDAVRMIPEDSASTLFVFDGNADTVITHRSTQVNDAFGSRFCSLVLTGDNRCYLVDEHGNDIFELPTIHVRATEYPSPQTMPAELPPNSAFTYCVELGVDSARNVRFEYPITIWVNNFLGFDVGETIPVGFYNRDSGFWEPSKNGIVIKLLDMDLDGQADALDVDGDDLPDDLDNSGSYADDIRGLEDPQQYAPGATFWRAETTHFTPCDLNFPQGTPGDAILPNPTTDPFGDLASDHTGKPCKSGYTASFVDERSRVLFEDIAIPGTNMKLFYTNSRVEGYHTILTVPVSGDSLPTSLKRIDVEVDIAGRKFTQTLDPLPQQVAEFFWDGLDYLGRSLQTPITGHVGIGFVYDSVYYRPGDFEQAFGQPGIEATSVPGREEITLWQRNNLIVTPARSKGTVDFAEGWSLAPHHHMNLQDLSQLYKGNGTVVHNNVRVISKYAGTGSSGYGGIGGPAVEAAVASPNKVAVDSAGNVYVAQDFYGAIYKIDPNGLIDRLTGMYQGWGFSGDGGPAINARIEGCGGLAIDSNGNVFFSDSGNFCVRKIDTEGIIHTIAGVPGSSGYSGDDGPAAQAQLSYPMGVAVDDTGNLYIADRNAHCVRKIDPKGIITTIAGGNGAGYSGDGGNAVDARINSPEGIAVDRSGNIYFTDSTSWGHHVIRRVDASGVITTFAGTSSRGFGGDGGPATAAQLFSPRDVAVDRVGNVYIADDDNQRIRMVNTNGVITTIAGSGLFDWDWATGPAVYAKFRHPNGVAVDDDGSVYVADTNNCLVKKISHPSAFTNVLMTGGNVFAEDSGQGYIVSIEGYHTQTIDLDTGATLYTYQYSDDRRLVSITDRFDSVTEVTRDTNGVPFAIIAPDGVTTGLVIDSDNHLTRIDYPGGSYFEFEYTPKGLLTAKIEPEGNRFEHLFDENGRLTNASDQEGGSWTYDNTTYSNGDSLTEIMTAEGNVTAYQDNTDSSGAYTSTITGPTGAETLFSRSADNLSTHKSLPCGVDLSFIYDLDSEYYYKTVKEMVETTPAGLERVNERNKTYQDTNGDGAPDLVTEALSVNDKTALIQNDVLLSQQTSTSPEGRVMTRSYDPDTLLPTDLSIPGLFDAAYIYDTSGRLTTISSGTREMSFTYNDEGFLTAITDPEGQVTTYSHDEAGRVTRVDRPDNTSIEFTYDRNGNMTILTSPSTIDHVFGYNTVNLDSSYQTPLSGNYEYIYDRDRQLTRINLPSGNQIDNIYASTRLVQMQTPEGNVDYTYLCGSKIDSITKGMESIAYEYDGDLVASETLTGTLNQNLAYDYNDDFHMTAITYAGSFEEYTYDNDGLLTGAGEFVVNRNADNGLPELVDDGTLSLSCIFNGYGEADEESATVNNQNIHSWYLVRNDNGRVIQKTETIDGITSDFTYTYDPMGRLLTVTKDGALFEEYRYDQNGQRSYEMNSLRNISGRSFTYSAEDHLLMAGTTSFEYDLDGFLTRKTEGADVTSYSYSSRGELLNVILPDGTLIEYIHDPLGRRIAKKLNGAIVEKYLWQGMTRLLSVYDGSDNLLMRFEYADGRMPLAMMKDGDKYYLSYDQVGSLRTVADSTGNVVKRIDYDSFGNIITDTTPAFEVLSGFAGGLHDRDTNLVRFGFRDYDPDIGRWTAKDPIFFNGVDKDLYGYVLNDPISLIDPLGLVNWKAVGTGTLVTFGGGVAVVTGALASTSGVGAIGGVPAALVGSAGIGWGVSQIIAGFTNNELPFMGTKEAIVKGTIEPGLLQDELLGINTLGDMLLTGRTAPTDIGKINSVIKSGYSIYNSGYSIISAINNSNNRTDSSSCK